MARRRAYEVGCQDCNWTVGVDEWIEASGEAFTHFFETGHQFRYRPTGHPDWCVVDYDTGEVQNDCCPDLEEKA